MSQIINYELFFSESYSKRLSFEIIKIFKKKIRHLGSRKLTSKEKEETPPYNLLSCTTSLDKLMVSRGCHAYHESSSPTLLFVFVANEETHP